MPGAYASTGYKNPLTTATHAQSCREMYFYINIAKIASQQTDEMTKMHDKDTSFDQFNTHKLSPVTVR